MRVATAAIVMQSFHAGHANGNLGEPFAPRPAESVSDDHGDGKVQSFLELCVDFCRRTVGIFRQQESVTAPVHVGDIHSTVGADQAVASLCDQDAAFAANDATALGDGQFDDASVQV